MIRRIVPVVLALVLSGCASFDVGRYGVGVDNAVALRKLGPSQVNVGPFTAAEPGRTEIGCRAVGPITTVDKRPFEDAIRQALVDELTVAEMLSHSAPVTLTGRVDKLDFDSMAGAWDLALTVTSSNGRAVAITQKYDYGFTYIAETACARTAKSFMPAVQALIGGLVRHPDFPGLLR